MKTGERIKARRKEIGISADVLAGKIGVSRSTIFRYENGAIEKIPMNHLAPIAKALNTSTAYLMGWEEIDNAPTSNRDERTELLMDLISGLSDSQKEMIIAQLKIILANRGKD